GLLEFAGAVCDAVSARIPLRDDVMAVAQNAVERAQPGDELRPRGGGQRQVDDGVYRRVAHPDPVARALGVGRLRAEEVEQVGARRLVAGNAQREEIEVERVEPLAIQGEVGTSI